MVSEVQNKCRILVVENSHDAARAGLPEELRALGHEVVTMCARDEAMAREDFEQFDLIVSDLDDRELSQDEIVEAFKLGVTSPSSRRTKQFSRWKTKATDSMCARFPIQPIRRTCLSRPAAASC